MSKEPVFFLLLFVLMTFYFFNRKDKKVIKWIIFSGFFFFVTQLLYYSWGECRTRILPYSMCDYAIIYGETYLYYLARPSFVISFLVLIYYYIIKPKK